MPLLRFTQDDKPYEFDIDTITTLEAIELKKLTGLTVQKWAEGLEVVDAESFRAFVWFARKRAGDLPPGKYSEFDFPLLQVAATFDVEDDEADADPTPARTSKPKSRRTGH
jgi:hypothetical protein